MSRKRSTEKRRKRDLYLTGIRTLHHIRRWNITHGITKRKSRHSKETDINPSWSHENYARILLPKKISIEHAKSRSELLTSIQQIHLTAKKGQNIVLDFTQTEQLYAPGMLLLYAEIRNLRQIYPKVQIVAHCPKIRQGSFRLKRDRIRQVLKQIGLFEFTKCFTNLKPRLRDVMHWKFVCGSKADGDKIAAIDWRDNLTDDLSELVYAGIMEAANNCVDHAYQYRQREFSQVRDECEGWWLFSHVHQGTISFIFCDLGIGIPKSLPLGPYGGIWKKISTRKRDWTDSEKISKSTTLGVSATDKSYRGRGLNAMIKLAETHEDARVIIYSNAGLFKMHFDKRQEFERDYSDSINGTIIQFVFPLLRQEQSHGKNYLSR